MRLSLTKKIIFSLILLTVFFGLVEGVLHLLDVKIPDAPVVVERIMNSDVRFDWLEEDSLVFWKLAGDVPGATVFRTETLSIEQEKQLCDEYGNRVQPLENCSAPASAIPQVMPGRTDAPKKEMPRLSANFDHYDMQPVSTEHDPETQRIICLGDSCTFFGRPSYPKRLETLMNCDNQSVWQVINAGVPAYSSYQGYRLFEQRLTAFKARFVTVYFGWNDHWIARSVKDAAHGKEFGLRTVSHRVDALFGFLRFDDAIRRISDLVRERLPRIDSGGKVLRVPLPDYRQNLTGIVRVAAMQDTRVVFLTAPQGFDRKNPPKYLQEMDYFDDLSRLIDTHESYNDCVREVALQTGSILVDLAALVDKMPNRRELFLQDGIHLSDTGLEFVGRHVCRDIRSILESK